MAKEPKPNGVDHTDDEDIEITLDAPTPEEVKVAPQDDAPVIVDPPPAAVAAEDGIETLRANLAAEKSARLTAEEDARRARTESANAGKTVQETNLTLVTGAIANTNAAIDRMESDYAQALTDGDHAAAAKINRAMSQSMSELSQLESGKVALEAEAKRPVQTERRTSGDPVEDFISGVDITRQSADWLRAHPDYVTNPGKNQEMIAAHNLLMARGVRVDTPEYFSGVENVLGISQREEPREEAISSAEEAVQRRQSPASAPVSRGGGMDGQKKPGTVRLSAAEVEMAAQMGQTVQEYAANKQALINEGKLN